ncbi:kinase-like protein, partial [Rhodotorula sp. JG-1b]
DEERIGPYLIREEIGRGSFATVFRGVRYDTHAPVAIKAVVRSKLTAKLLENLESEISILKRIVHHNIVELKDCLKTDSHIYLVMDFCSAGDLSIYIRKRGDLPSLTASNQGLPAEEGIVTSGTEKVLYPHPKEGGLNETIVRCFLGQLVDGLRFMRNANVIHRDIKPQNLLLQPATASELAAGHPPGIPVLKVADFGFARWLPSQSMAETLCGSPLYMAPEILRYEKYDAKADLWSVGAVLFEMSVGKPPFRAQNHVDLLRKIERGEDRIKFPDEKRQEPGDTKVPTKVADDLKALIRRLLKRHPAERMSFEDFFREAEIVSRSGSAARLPKSSSSSSSLPARPAREDAARSASPAIETSAAGASHVRRPMSRFAPPDDPPPFARRTSANPSAPSPPLGYTGSGPARRASSYTSRYGALPQDASREVPPSARDSPVPRSASAGQAPANTTGAVDAPPPSAVDRFATSARGADSLMNSNDSVLGTDYVVVEKRTVEINALADELAQLSPRQEGIVARRPSRGFLSRPLSSLGNPSSGPADSSPSSGSAPPSPYPPVASDGSTPPFAIPPRPQPSHHPYSMSSSPRPLSYLSSSPRSVSYPVDRFPGSPLALVGSPSTALAKAISNLSSLKIFGSPSDGILVRRNSARKPIPRSMTAPVAVDPEEERVLAGLEDTAQKALVLFEFADSKLLRLLPPTPAASTSTTSLGTPSYFSHLAAREQAQAQSAAASNPFSAVPTSPSMRRNSSSSSGPDRPMILASSAKADVLAAEATVLYLKALAFLQRGIERARKHWSNRPSEQHAASADFNDAVQWFRQRFNECYDKADFAKTRCQDELPETTTYAEKLVYDRALELSRAAAVNELRGENPTDCETAYETALWLLYALLDDTMHAGSSASAAESEEDRATVSRFVHSITGRLTALRKKI